jgi:hypothetical protein
MTQIGGLMNAVEIIEEIKRLPEEEQEKVIEFARQQQAGQVRYADDATFEAAADKVFKSHSELLHKLAQ